MSERNRAWRRREARHAAEKESANVLSLKPFLEARAAAEAANPNACHHHPRANAHDLRLFWSTEQELRDAA